MIETLINGRWPLLLPEHRAMRPEWPWWEATRLAAMRTVIGPGDCVWDIGAEEGDFPALWAKWGAEVVLAEPNPGVWPNIRAIFEANHLERPVAMWQGFVGHEDKNSDGPDTDWPWTEMWPDCAYGPIIGDHGFCQLGERPDIPIATVDGLVALRVRPPTVITIDVEGSEFHVLAGAERTLRTYRPNVFVSIHEAFMEHHYGIENGAQFVREWMEAQGYRDTYLCTDHEAHWWFKP